MGAVVTAGAGARVRRGRSRLYAIGLGVAALSLVCAEAVVCSQAMAQSPFVRNRTGAPAAPTPVTGPALDAQAARALERQRSILLRNSQSLNSIRAAQEAARAKGLLGPNYAVDAAGAPLAANPDGSPRVVGEGVCVINCGGSDAGLVPRLDGWTGGGLRTNSGAIVRRPEDIGGFVNPDFNAVGADGRTTVTVKQEQSRAIFEWQRFDIGRGTTLTFDQAGNEGWLALNTVANSIAPSQILGRMRADGGALVLNSNGVIFGPNSQVNLRTLIASTNYLGSSPF
jgi:filamentous hemagglutinin family protein